jgi:putative Mn2+ efflux pump MntP
MFEIVILAIALSMDAFAVSISLGSKHLNPFNSLAFKSAMYFGVSQGLMPLIGYWGGKELLGWGEKYANWIAFTVLLLIGIKMIYESLSQDIEEEFPVITNKVLFALAIATSIDALAAGFTLPLLELNPFMACAMIGFTTFIFSWIGVMLGSKSVKWLGSKAELLGGIMLILIGLRILLF